MPPKTVKLKLLKLKLNENKQIYVKYGKSSLEKYLKLLFFDKT